MTLNPFSSYFEIFCGISLAYAGSETFRFGVNSAISNAAYLISDIKNFVSELKAELTVSSEGGTSNPNIEKRVAEVARKFEDNYKTLTRRKKKYSKFILSHKAMFLFSGLFCLSALLLIGYEQFYCWYETENFIAMYLVWLSCGTLVANLYVFFRSYYKRKLGKGYHFGKIVVVFLGWIIISKIGCHYDLFDFLTRKDFLQGKCNILIALFAGASGYLLYFFRSLHHEFCYGLRFFVLRRFTRYEIREIKNANDFIASTDGAMKKVPLFWSTLYKLYMRLDKWHKIKKKT